MRINWLGVVLALAAGMGVAFVGTRRASSLGIGSG